MCYLPTLVLLLYPTPGTLSPPTSQLHFWVPVLLSLDMRCSRMPYQHKTNIYNVVPPGNRSEACCSCYFGKTDGATAAEWSHCWALSSWILIASLQGLQEGPGVVSKLADPVDAGAVRERDRSDSWAPDFRARKQLVA